MEGVAGGAAIKGWLPFSGKTEINAFAGNNEQELLLYILRIKSDVYRGEEGNEERQNAAF